MASAMEDPSLFLQFFGDTPRFRMIDFLFDNRLTTFTKKEISEGAQVSWASLFNHWDELEKNGVVKVARKVGRIRLYQLDEKNQVVRQLMKIDLALMRQAADTAEEEATMKVKAKVGQRK